MLPSCDSIPCTHNSSEDSYISSSESVSGDDDDVELRLGGESDGVRDDPREDVDEAIVWWL